MCQAHTVTKDVRRSGSSARVRRSAENPLLGDGEGRGVARRRGRGAAGSECEMGFRGKSEGSAGLGLYVMGSRDTARKLPEVRRALAPSGEVWDQQPRQQEASALVDHGGEGFARAPSA